MRRTSTDTPFLSWCLVVRNAEATVEATLKSLREQTPEAEIVVVDTMSKDATPEICKRYADLWIEYQGPLGIWTREQPWIDDMCAARQLSFEKASGKWRGWIDADDRLPGREETLQILALNGMKEPTHGENIVGNVEERSTVEDEIRRVEELVPEADCIYAPYLYARDKATGKGHVWQWRERIVRWDPERWGWREQAHEILVPLTGAPPPYVEFSHLLFLHEKVFDEEATDYATRRHFAVLQEQFDRGEQTSRRALYLAQYANKMAPEREVEFINAAHSLATQPYDRYFALLEAARYHEERGLYFDALEAYGSAINLCPNVPDAYLQAGNMAFEAEDLVRAIQWFETGTAIGYVRESRMNPRHLRVFYPTRLVSAYVKLAEKQAEGQNFDAATALWEKACHLIAKVAGDPAIHTSLYDRVEASALQNRIVNAALAHKQMRQLQDLFQYLLGNDEPQKAMRLLDAIPWSAEDHPIAAAMEVRIRPVRRHLTDPDAYAAFYQDTAHGATMPTPVEFLDPENPASKRNIARAHWTAEWIRREMPEAKVLDVGCFDGQSGIPILKLCPEISYLGVDLNKSAIERFRGYLEKSFPGRKVQAEVIGDPWFTRLEAQDLGRDDRFDAILWFEVIEHVEDPVFHLQAFKDLLDLDGLIFISTPWGAHDLGNPPERDIRGHVRAYTLWTFTRDCREAGLEPYEVYCYRPERPRSDGDTMHAAVKKAPLGRRVSICVPASLWDWNGRSLKANGMGASEKMIVYLGERFAKERPVEVFGQVPEEEFSAGVGYFSNRKIYRLDGDSKVIVSRSPGWGASLDEVAGTKLEKILWLQDTHYGDLNAATAEAYERIICVSDWHKSIMIQNHEVPEEKIEVIPNAILPELFERGWREVWDKDRNPNRFIYCSSPDRGLIKLLELWPHVRELIPDAELSIFYGWRGCKKLGSGRGVSMGWIQRHESTRKRYDVLRHQPGITEVGMVSPEAFTRELFRAGFWFYPTNFCETFGTVAAEVQAAGVIPVCTSLAGLNESAAGMYTYWIEPENGIEEVYGEGYDDRAIEALMTAVKDARGGFPRKHMAERAIEKHAIDNYLPRWRKLIDG